MSWDGSPSRFTDEQYRRSCVLDRGADYSDGVKERYGLPVREPDGTLNCEGVVAARRMIGKVQGASEEQIAAAKRKLDQLAKQCESESRDRPTVGEVEERTLPEEAELRVEGNRLHGLIPYGVESRDLGGWREVIEPGALTFADKGDLVATLNHNRDRLLGRYDVTLQIEDRDDGFAWSCELPQGPTGQDVREAVKRGDLNQSSWRMVVGQDRWEGQTRHVEEVRELRDVAVVTTGAYPADSTRVELRERPDHTHTHEHTEEDKVENREDTPSGGLVVEDRSGEGGKPVENRILDAMAAVPKGEARDLTHATAEPVEPPELATFLWDRLREQSVVLASGVPVVSTDRKSVKWPSLIGDIEVDFYGELEEIKEDDPEFDDFELEPKAIKGLVRGSSEAFEDSDPDLLQIVQNNLTASMSLKFDAEALVGGSAKGFKGMAKMEGVQTLDMKEAEFADYDAILAAVGLLAAANVPGPYAVAMHPLVATSIDRLKQFTTAETNIPLPRPEGLPPIYVSPQVGKATGKEGKPDTSPVLVDAPRSLLCVRRRDVTVEIDRSPQRVRS